MTVVVFAGELAERGKPTDVNTNSKAKAKVGNAACHVRFKCHRPRFIILASLGLTANLYQEQDKQQGLCLYLLLFAGRRIALLVAGRGSQWDARNKQVSLARCCGARWLEAVK